jgi:hypothetical protein
LTGAPAAQAGTAFYEVAFQTNTGNLATDGVQNDGTLSGLNAMMPGTSPSITFNEGNNLADSPSGFEEAYQDTIGQLDTFGPDGFQIWATDMAPGTSPSISDYWEAGIELAYHDSAGDIITEGGVDGLRNWGPAWPGTSPSVTVIGLGLTTR